MNGDNIVQKGENLGEEVRWGLDFYMFWFRKDGFEKPMSSEF